MASQDPKLFGKNFALTIGNKIYPLARLTIPKQKDDQNVFNWRTRAQNNCDPADGAGDSAGGAQEDLNFTITVQNLTLAEFKPKTPAIPHAGIRTGEIIGHRGWLVLRGHRLCSMAHIFVWLPGQVVHGDLDKMVGTNYHIPIYGGVYAFKSHDQCAVEYEALLAWAEMCLPAELEVGYHRTEVIGIVVGTIKMWGEVIEHKRGYRAQYARVNSIDEAWGSMVELPLLQGKYWV